MKNLGKLWKISYQSEVVKIDLKELKKNHQLKDDKSCLTSISNLNIDFFCLFFFYYFHKSIRDAFLRVLEINSNIHENHIQKY